MKTALVCGAGGFIGGHPSTELRAGLVKKLKQEGYWVRGVDIKERQSRALARGTSLRPRQPVNSCCWTCASRRTAGRR